ncbi:hypothetical protein NXS19_003707 [Fusarium pseudograminearum]|uniref:Tetratricopeptide SHNi-TPR domain-containing protein n=1 Tax=Fusarium pseudograminearum (strain CS3096) TaxID=1028729 RepID=K3VKF7_FUSPC|nr:hypothetical protein FPSE_04539 [Fusarium pseudograminearum CS3096]EKJ75282.1 hypothetical protein FPSE_04539 [Fusarium pseudograminearum CS3096]KAF0641626.1 hypothetical protein FPSE5266_04539 [Fusarium pseudograminearum]UZP35891.1 hypothetical protein NXS19_003707 [Fusarium pseudograminearum]
MSDVTEQTAPVVDKAAATSNESLAPPADDVANVTEKVESATITPAIGTPSVGTPNTDFLIANDQDPNSKKVTLADLSAKGAALYARKSYEEAAEVFSRASILQAELNGETSPDNAEILFHYGRSLFKVGQSKSDVLGGTAAPEKKKESAETKPKKSAQAETEKVTQEGVGIVAEQKEGEKKPEDIKGDKKALFQFTGDENFDESDEEENAEGDEDEEEDDDLATAFEILDLARVCYLKRLEALEKEEQEESGKGKEAAEGDSPVMRHVKERLADTHDALSEISLENERYPNAIEDGRTSLKYKLELYPEESEIIAEAHFKLSLALEFASVTTPGDDGANAKREEMDQGLRDEAIKEMELAIKSSKLKLQNKEVELATMASPEDNELARKSIQEMKEVIGDMEQRLVDLRNDPVDTKDILGADASIGGILGAAIGESAAETKARVEEAKKTATDLSGLVRKKNKEETATEAAPEPAPEAEANGKRKAEEPAEDAEAKKTKVEA